MISAVVLYGATSGYHPYSYYQLLRWIVCISAALGAWRFALRRWYLATAVLVFGAILFNPISPIRMHRFQWQTYDLWSAIGCVVLAITLVAALRMSRPDRST